MNYRIKNKDQALLAMHPNSFVYNEVVAIYGSFMKLPPQPIGEWRDNIQDRYMEVIDRLGGWRLRQDHPSRNALADTDALRALLLGQAGPTGGFAALGVRGFLGIFLSFGLRIDPTCNRGDCRHHRLTHLPHRRCLVA